MEYLPNGYTLKIYDGCFPLSTDTMALAHFIRLPKQARVLDLGSGCGTLGLLLCSRDATCHVTGVEIDPIAHNGAQENILHNGLQERMESICSDLRLLPAGCYDCCVSNPPYFSGGPAGRLQVARREDLCSMEDLFHTAARCLKFGGDFFLVHRPEQLARLFACAANCSLEPKRLCLLRHKAGGPVALVLVHCRKGAKAGLVWEELTLHDDAGAPTNDYKSIYHC